MTNFPFLKNGLIVLGRKRRIGRSSNLIHSTPICFFSLFVKKSFAEYNASKLRISATEKQTQATDIALEGVKQEFQLGTRTTLDILDAEQEYLDARVSLVTAKNDSNISLFRLSYYLGTLTPENLNMDIIKYDPNKNYKRVKTIKIGPNRIKVIGNVD